ncbi:mitochondrial import inner membrane translocase subunit Tim10 B [Notolabrus celidotus]|uniref:mitochondrial import inner membrane translocase subunit Tim10 B n=1 Tax=Notolabrus celidotus TaxID=1203425 RepID=UPI00148FD487|nr:mitochondrial import inner membrane translocase subunit Tim10 B [Notolabrus celidotus]
MDPDLQLRNLKDFLLVYNRMTEICFQRCTSNFNYRNLTMDEERCVDSCAGKLIRSNHRLMSTYVQLMPRMVQKRMEEMESKAAENAKAAEAAALASVAAPATEALPEPQTPIISSPALEIPSLTDVTPAAFGSVLTPAGSDFPVGLDAIVPASTAATEVKLSAAAAITPVTEAVNLPVFNEAGNGLSSTAGVPLPPMADFQIDSGSSASVFVPSKPTPVHVEVPVSTVAAPTPVHVEVPVSIVAAPTPAPVSIVAAPTPAPLPVQVPVSTVAAPSVSLSMESKPQSGQERPPEVPPPSGQ